MSRLEWRCCMNAQVLLQFLAAVASGQTAVAADASKNLTQTAFTFDSSSFGNQPTISIGSISESISGRQGADDMGWGTRPEVSRKSWADCGSLRLPTLIHVSPSAGGVRGQGDALPYAPRPYASRPGASSESPSPLSTSLPSRFSPGPRLLLASESLPGSVSSRRRETEAGSGRAEASGGRVRGGRPAGGGGGIARASDHPPEGLGVGAGRTPNPNTCKTHARTQAHAHRHALGGGGRGWSVRRQCHCRPPPFRPPEPMMCHGSRTYPGWRGGRSGRATVPCNRRRRATGGRRRRGRLAGGRARGELRGVGADRGGGGGERTVFFKLMMRS